jgi:hypothetical protein
MDSHLPWKVVSLVSVGLVFFAALRNGRPAGVPGEFIKGTDELGLGAGPPKHLQRCPEAGSCLT